MSWKDLSEKEAVVRALNEFDQVGRDAFLKKYRFGRSSRFVLTHEGKEYDAKAIIGAAHGYQFPNGGPLASKDFPSEGRVVRGKLEELGFTIVTR